MTGTCSGWVAYSYITKDPYVLVGSAPGLLVSIWLNFGAIKLQYNPMYDIRFNSLQNKDVEQNKNEVKGHNHVESSAFDTNSSISQRNSIVSWRTISLASNQKSKVDDETISKTTEDNKVKTPSQESYPHIGATSTLSSSIVGASSSPADIISATGRRILYLKMIEMHGCILSFT